MSQDPLLFLLTQKSQSWIFVIQVMTFPSKNMQTNRNKIYL